MAKTEKIELKDIRVPYMNEGDTSIVFQRHGEYIRNRTAENAGSVTPESVEEMASHDREFFDELFQQPDVYVLFTSSDTEYAGKGQRSMETAQVALDAAVAALEDANLSPKERIINLNRDFKTARNEEKDLDIRPLPGVREPQIFNPEDAAYMTQLQEKYGYADEEAKVGLAPRGWAMHEVDAEKEVRLTTGAEGTEDLIARTEHTLHVIERYAKIWHAHNPQKRLVVWLASHYDTISPIVKKAEGVLYNSDGTLSEAYQPVNYGGGVMINIPADSAEALIETPKGKIPLELGKTAAKLPVTELGRPNY